PPVSPAPVAAPSGRRPSRPAGFPQVEIRWRADASAALVVEAARERRVTKMKRIVIAYDGFEGSREALATGVETARATGAGAALVYVRHTPLPIVGDPFYERALSRELRRGRDVLAEAQAFAADAGVVAETELLEGDPAEQ